MNLNQPSKLVAFIKQNKQLLLISVPLFLTLLVIIIFITSSATQPNRISQRTQNIKPTPITNPTVAKEKLSINTVSPQNGATNIKIYSQMSVTFANVISEEEKKNISLSISPSISASTSWSSDNKTLFFTPATSLASQTDYTMTVNTKNGIYTWKFQTVSNDNISEEEIMKVETESAEFTKRQDAEFDKNYPWWDNFPLQSARYFTYFDPEKRTFIGLLYPQRSNPSSINTQTDQMKTEILSKIRGFGINVEQYGIEWKVTPEP